MNKLTSTIDIGSFSEIKCIEPTTLISGSFESNKGHKCIEPNTKISGSFESLKCIRAYTLKSDSFGDNATKSTNIDSFGDNATTSTNNDSFNESKGSATESSKSDSNASKSTKSDSKVHYNESGNAARDSNGVKIIESNSTIITTKCCICSDSNGKIATKGCKTNVESTIERIKCTKCGSIGKTESLIDVHEPNYEFMKDIREVQLYERNRRVVIDISGRYVI